MKIHKTIICSVYTLLTVAALIVFVVFLLRYENEKKILITKLEANEETKSSLRSQLSKYRADNLNLLKRVNSKISIVDVQLPLKSPSFLDNSSCINILPSDNRITYLKNKISPFILESILECSVGGRYSIYFITIESETGHKSYLATYSLDGDYVFSTLENNFLKECEYVGGREVNGLPIYTSARGAEFFIACNNDIHQIQVILGKSKKNSLLYVTRTGYGMGDSDGFVRCSPEYEYCMDKETVSKLINMNILAGGE